MPIILVGFMGTGKTTVGKYLSDLYNLSYVDLDNFIEVNECKSIPDIFNDIGEKGFRSLETKYLKACLNTFDIISTGGGIIEDTNSLKLLKSQKNVVWLDCDIEIIFKRKMIHIDPMLKVKILTNLMPCILQDFQDIMKSHS